MPINNKLAHLALLGVALIYGANYTIAKSVLDDGFMTPNAFILLRIGFGAAMFMVLRWIWIKGKVDRKDIPTLILCGFFGTAVNQLMFFKGLKLTTAIHASLLMLTVPLVVLILSTIFLKERLTLRTISGIILGAAGAALLIVYGKQSGEAKNIPLGDFFIFLNASSYAIYLIIAKKLLKKYNPFLVISYVFLFGFVFILPIGIGDLIATEWSSFDASIWWSVGYVLLFTTFFAYYLNVYALGSVSATLVSTYIYLQPLIASFIAISLGKEGMDSTKLTAGILIFLAVYLVSFAPAKKIENKLGSSN